MNTRILSEHGRLHSFSRSVLRYASFLILLNCFMAPVALAQQCEALFGEGLQTHSGQGFIDFGLNAQLIGNPDSYLKSKSVSDSWWSISKSCGGSRCKSDGGIAGAFYLPNFPTFSSEADVLIPWGGQGIVGENYKNHFNQIQVGTGSTLEFDASNDQYFIKKLDVLLDGTLVIPAGDYWIETLNLGIGANVRVKGEGTARLFVLNDTVISSSSDMNIQDGTPHDNADQLFIYVHNSLQINPQARIAATIYTRGSARISEFSTIYGAMNAESIKLGTSTKFYFQNDVSNKTRLDGVCGNDITTDTDDDGIPDALDNDIDGDGFSNQIEAQLGSNPVKATSHPEDLDNNGIADALENYDNACIGNYQNGIQLHNSLGGINFGYNAQLLNSSAYGLLTHQLSSDVTSLKASCDGVFCYEAGYTVSPFDDPEFINTTLPDPLIIEEATSIELGGDFVTEYSEIQVSISAELTFVDDNVEYIINRLLNRDSAVINLAPGDYFIGSLDLGPTTRINVMGEGTARIFVKGDISIGAGSLLNTIDRGSVGHPEKLLIYGYSDIHIGSDVEVNALVYAKGAVNVGSFSKIYGAVTAGAVHLGWDSYTFYRPESVGLLDFGRVCDADNDGIYDLLDEDRDGDGISNDYEEQLGTDPNDPTSTPPDLDGDSIPDAFDTDIDGDGVPNELDVFPTDPTESTDLDGDGIGDNSDPDRDGDGISNVYENQLGTDPNDASSSPPDMDGDSIPDALDSDLDGDGVDNEEDAFPSDATESSDLDGDGIGDNSDPDRDGDLFPNTEEEAAGRDPNDPNDYPVELLPRFTWLTPVDHQVIPEISTVITGQLSGKTKYLSKLVASNDRFGDVEFEAVVNEDNSFYVEVPLLVANNVFTVSLVDVKNLTQTAQRTVARLAPPIIEVTSPENNIEVDTETISITGNVNGLHSTDVPRVVVNNQQIVPDLVTEGMYSFAIDDYPLSLGLNHLNISAESATGKTTETMAVMRTLKENEQHIPADISIIYPKPGITLIDESFWLVIDIKSEYGLLSASVNSEPVDLPIQNQGVYRIKHLVKFEGDAPYQWVINAVDILNQEVSYTVSYQYDADVPELVIDNLLEEYPVVNTVHELPYRITGRVIDNDLSTVTFNGQPVDITPLSGSTYVFEGFVDLTRDAESHLEITAWDASGHKVSKNYLLNTDGILELNVIVPEPEEQFEASLNAQISTNLRIDGMEETDQLYIGWSKTSLSLVDVVDGYASSELLLPAVGDHTIYYQVVDGQGSVRGESHIKIKVVEATDIPTEVVETVPSARATMIEPHQPIQIHFNQSVDLNDLVIDVRETVNGVTYVESAEASEGLARGGSVLEEVYRNNMPVAGGLSILPGNKIVEFYPAQDLGYGANVTVNVKHKGNRITRYTFETRPLPTYIEGSVLDSFNEAIPGLTLKIKELGLISITDNDGAYSFGYESQVGEHIPSGRYTLVINPGFDDPRFGTQEQAIQVKASRRNRFGITTLQVLDPSIPFVPLSGGMQDVRLALGDMVLDLSEASLRFPNGQTRGNVHTQLLLSHMVQAESTDYGRAIWYYSSQPMGIQVSGTVRFEMQLPQQFGSHAYIPDTPFYVLLLGINNDNAVIEPVGIGQINKPVLTSIEPVSIQRLDYLGYSYIHPDDLEKVDQYIDGALSWKELLSQLTAFGN